MSTSPLYDWQQPHANKLVKAVRLYGSAKDGSDTGTGKTVIAVHVAKELGLLPFVLCPKSVIPSWRGWVTETFPQLKLGTVHNYESLRGGKTMFIKRKGKGYAWQLDRDKMLLIFDEDHRCKSEKSLNSKMLIAARKQGYRILLLGATSFSSPLDMKALGYALGLHDNNDWWKWCLSNECRPKTWGGLEYNGSVEHLKSLHDLVYKDKGSRIRVADLPDGAFPDSIVEANSFPMGNPDDINDIYETMHAELKVLEERKAGDEDMQLTIQLRARQEVELLKVPVLLDLVNELVQDGKSVVVFLNFKASIDSLLGSLEDPCCIVGGQTTDEREANIQRFQNDGSFVMVCAMQAGGVGVSLHDTLGNRPRVSLINPSFSAIDLRQALGRIHRAGGKTAVDQHIIFAEGTIEDDICRSVRQKIRNIDLINDKDVTPCGI